MQERRFFSATGLARLVIWSVLVVWIVGIASVAWGRAGGGGGYGGGGGGGSGGGGGGEVFVALIYWLVILCVERPLIGIPLVIVILAGLAFCGRKSGQRGLETYHRHGLKRANAFLGAGAIQLGLEGIRQRDANFSVEQFLVRVDKAFEKIQVAWSAQQLSPVRPFVSDGIYERFQLQIQEQKDLGYRNVMDDVRITSHSIARASSDQHFEELTVRFQASATDYRVDLKTGKEIRGFRRQASFTEYWSFLRRPGAQTGREDGLIEGFCPNCSTPVELNQSAKCESCDSVLRSGEYDWVLAEITQASEWPPRQSKSIPGIEQLVEQDSGFNIQHVEDRVSVIFWRRVMADRIGNAGPLRKVSAPSFCDALQEQYPQDSTSRNYLGDCAVGAVETLATIQDDQHDRVLVGVHWSGHSFSVDDQGQHRRGKGTRLMRQMFVLQRQANVRSSLSQSIDSAHCPACGAPETDMTDPACGFCGEVLNEGRHDFVLSAVHDLESAAANQLLDEARRAQPVEAEPIVSSQLVSTPRAKALLAWAVHVALADRVLDNREREMLQRVGQARRVPADEIDQMIKEVQQGELQPPIPRDLKEARTWLEGMADAALADGHIDPAELTLMRQAGESFGYSRFDIRMIVRRRTAQLHAAARQQIRIRKSDSANGGGVS